MTDALRAVIGRAVVDRDFRGRLFADLGGTAAEYGLTGAEVDALKSLRHRLQDFVPRLDDVIAKMTKAIFCA